MQKSTADFEWAVIGAGPAGIAAVGKLIDSGISPKKIAWVDPAFKVGDFGTTWRNVPSNTSVALFIRFLQAVKAFSCPTTFPLYSLNPKDTCELSFMAEPLEWVTAKLKKEVSAKVGTAHRLKSTKRGWEIFLENEDFYARNVILAIGAEPKTLPLTTPEHIPLEVAMNWEKLSHHCHKDDMIAVFGSSHSAVLIIRYLLENTDVKHIVNFYNSPFRYAVYLENEILFDDTGLKGTTAAWAREHMHGKLPARLTRALSTDEHLLQHLPLCTKSIHAVGFQKRIIPIDGMKDLTYNDRSGIIAPGLFGFGIAFPEAKTDRFGNVEYRVGLWKFMNYLDYILPIWLQYPA